MADAVNNLLKTIPNSGHLTANIIYQFPPTSLAFGKDGSIQAGISGAVFYNGETYSGTSVSVPLPPVTEHDVHVYVNNYEFDALLWAFYENGTLALTVTPDMLPGVLNTGYMPIKDALPKLYNFAPDADISLLISATQPPTVSNGNIYVLTEAAADKLNLPVNVRSAITRIINTYYVDKTTIDSALQTELTPEDYLDYGSKILGAVQTQLWLFLDTQAQIVVEVMKQETKLYAFSFLVEKKDIFRNFAVSRKQSTQKLAFDFGEVLTSTRVIDSVIGEVGDGVDSIWTFGNIYLNQQLHEIGQDGVALPSLEGFLFDNTTITLFDQNVGVDTDVFYGNVAQLLRVRRKRERRSERTSKRNAPKREKSDWASAH